jgi:large subunit ribosomal protein L21
VPKPDGSLSAVVVSGGKQYRVAPGDQVLVDRLSAEPGSTVKLGRVLLMTDGDEVKVGRPAVEGVDVEARILAHRRGPRIEVLRYKSKKRVRVHRGARADLTAVEILTIGAEAAKPAARATRKRVSATVEAGPMGTAPAEGETPIAPKRAARKPRTATKATATTTEKDAE